MNFPTKKNLQALDDASLVKRSEFWTKVGKTSQSVLYSGIMKGLGIGLLVAAIVTTGGAVLGALSTGLAAVAVGSFAGILAAKFNLKYIVQELTARKTAAKAAAKTSSAPAAPKPEPAPQAPAHDLGKDFHAGAAREVSVGPSLKLKTTAQKKSLAPSDTGAP
jgi:predicted lipid-binding transport protein (Tim44 family)